jgi:hypothetical protein
VVSIISSGIVVRKLSSHDKPDSCKGQAPQSDPTYRFARVKYFWFHDAGASSWIASEDNGGLQMTTISIGGFVEEQRLDRVDFIKFEIEGAERHALDGAADTIRRYAPKLALSAYHLPDDPFVLAQKVLALRPITN